MKLSLPICLCSCYMSKWNAFFLKKTKYFISFKIWLLLISSIKLSSSWPYGSLSSQIINDRLAEMKENFRWPSQIILFYRWRNWTSERWGNSLCSRNWLFPDKTAGTSGLFLPAQFLSNIPVSNLTTSNKLSNNQNFFFFKNILLDKF